MNWNAVIKSLQEEANHIRCRLEDNTLPSMHRDCRLIEVSRMDLYIGLAKALAEGMKTNEAIPAAIYYSNGKFFDRKTRISLDNDFYEKWKYRAFEFPGTPYI